MRAAATDSGLRLTFVTRRARTSGAIGAVAHASEWIRYDRLASVPARRAGLDGVVRAPRPESLAAASRYQGRRVARLLALIERGPLWKLYVQKSRALLPDVDDADEADRVTRRDPATAALASRVAQSRARGRDAARGA